MGKQTVPVEVQAAPAQRSLQSQKQPRPGQEGEAQGARDADTWTNVARRTMGSDGEEAARKGDGERDDQGEERHGVRRHPDMSQVQVS